MEGYLELNNRTYFFTFDNVVLKLIPRDMVYCTIEEIQDALNGNSKDNIPYILEGKLIDRVGKIYFFVKKVINHTINIGVYEIEIYSYTTTIDSELKIDSISIYSDELNWFYNIKKAYDYSLTINTGKASVNLKEDHNLRKIFKFKLDDVDIVADLNISRSIANMSKNPITLASVLNFKFDTTDNLELIFKLIYLTEKFLSFITYRKNVYIDTIGLNRKNENGKFSNCGKVYINRELDSFVEQDKVIQNRIIDFDLVEDNCADIFQLLSNELVYLEHIPVNSRDSRVITPARFVLITAAFEWEFRHIYGSNLKEEENDIFKNSKVEVLKMLEEKINSTTGKLKKNIKLYKRIIENIDMSLSEKIQRVLNDNSNILDCFIRNIYLMNGISEVKYSDIAGRIQTQRNNYAHGNIDKEIDSLVILDLLILEWAIYCMVLTEVGVSEDRIKKCINKLFNRNMDI